MVNKEHCNKRTFTPKLIDSRIFIKHSEEIDTTMSVTSVSPWMGWVETAAKMSLRRVSVRVREHEQRMQEQAELDEKRAFEALHESLGAFFECLNGSTVSVQDMVLPIEWMDTPSSKRRCRENEESETEEEDDYAPKLKVAKFAGPPFRKLRQNLYRHPLQRTIVPVEECPICDCKPGTGCGIQCHNRLVYM